MMEHADTFVTGRKPRLERDGTGVIKWLEKARDGGLVFGATILALEEKFSRMKN